MTKKRNTLLSQAQMTLDFPTIPFYTGLQADNPPSSLTTYQNALENKRPLVWSGGTFEGDQRKRGTLIMSILLPIQSIDKCINPEIGLSDNSGGLFAFTGGV